MTQEQYNNWENEVHNSLFHVEKTDLDDKYKVRIDQIIVLEAITSNPEVLKLRDLKDLLIHFDVL
jgi:hypothetical protein